MIETSLYKKILDQGLLLDHYVVLCNIRDKSVPDWKRISGFINLLHKKGYLEEGELTPLAVALLEGRPEPLVQPVEEKKIDSDFDYADWIIGLHKRLETKISELTGKKQVRDSVRGGKPYSFLPNSTDLGKVLLKVIRSYGLRDLDKIERCLMKHIEECSRKGSWFPLMQYYILKDKMSTLVTDIDTVDEESNDDTTVNI